MAEALLFRHVVVYPTSHSFRKLTWISTHPQLRHYVQGITYCGDMLPEMEELDNSEALSYSDWLSRIGKGMNPSKPIINAFRRESQEKILAQRYGCYVRHVQGQITLRTYFNQANWLSDNFGELPNLKLFGFATQKTDSTKPEVISLTSMRRFSPLVQNVLMERCTPANPAHSVGQIMALLVAASWTDFWTQSTPKTYKLDSVPW